jgi:hypothetical protein
MACRGWKRGHTFESCVVRLLTARHSATGHMVGTFTYLSELLPPQRHVRETDGNPAANALPIGISESALTEGIARSGYPVQGMVAAELLKHCHVSEEWGFRDPQTGDHRALDIRGSFFTQPPEGRQIQQLVHLLIECKSSTKPFIFFKAVTDRQLPGIQISGIGGRFELKDERGRTRIETPVAQMLGLDDLEWFSKATPVATSFAVAHPKGKSPVELSGTEAYNGAVLPLCKALDFARSRAPDGDRTRFIYPTVHIPVLVLDAPMVLVEDPSQADDPLLVPRLRILRHEASAENKAWARDRLYQIEVVHLASLAQFIDEVTSLKDRLWSAVLEKEAILRAGGGTVPDLDSWSASDVRPLA